MNNRDCWNVYRFFYELRFILSDENVYLVYLFLSPPSIEEATNRQKLIPYTIKFHDFSQILSRDILAGFFIRFF